jgi:Skp family chaperone for outer membrane proteins
MAGPGPLVSAHLKQENRTVKRTVILLAGAAALVAAIYVVNQLRAQQGGANQQAAAQPLRTRVALVNLAQVIKNYDKYKAFEVQWQNEYKDVEKSFDAKKTLLTQYQTAMQDPKTDQPTKDAYEKKMRDLQYEMQTMGEDAKKTLGKKRDDMFVQIYREIEDAVTRCARSYDLELVMHFNDAVGTADKYHPVNITRKMQSSACMPLYVTNGMDITDYITQVLNQSYKTAMASPPAGGAAAAPAQGRPQN